MSRHGHKVLILNLLHKTLCPFSGHKAYNDIFQKTFLLLLPLVLVYPQHILFNLLTHFFFFLIQITPYKASEATVVQGLTLLSPLPRPEPLLGQGYNTHTHTRTHTHTHTQPCITYKHDMKSLLVREQVDGSTVLSTKTKQYIQGHSTKLLLPEGTMV